MIRPFSIDRCDVTFISIHNFCVNTGIFGQVISRTIVRGVCWVFVLGNAIDDFKARVTIVVIVVLQLFYGNFRSHGPDHVRKNCREGFVDFTNIPMALLDNWRQKRHIKPVGFFDCNLAQNKSSLANLSGIDFQKVCSSADDPRMFVGQIVSQGGHCFKCEINSTKMVLESVFCRHNSDLRIQIVEFFVDLFVETVELFI